MSGLLLLIILGMWVALIKWLTTLLTHAMQPGLFKKIIQLGFSGLLLIAPVADDIIGGFQFKKLCETETEIKYNKEKLLNKKVNSKLLDAEDIEYMMVPVISQTWSYQDIEGHEILLSYKTLDAEGGWLSRAIGFQSLSRPFTFNGHCGPGWTKVDEIFHRLHVTVTNN